MKISHLQQQSLFDITNCEVFYKTVDESPGIKAVIFQERENCVYGCGEKIRFHYGLVQEGKYVPGRLIRCRFEAEGQEFHDYSVMSEDHPFVWEVSLDQPGCIFMASQCEYDASSRTTSGAVVEPDKIMAEPAPDDFVEFWRKRMIESAEVPLNVTRFQPVLPKLAEFIERLNVWDVQVACAGGRPVSGYLCIPKNALPKTLPIYVYLHGAGISRACQSTVMADHGFITFNMNAIGIDNQMSPDEFMILQEKDGDYSSRKYEHPEDSFFVGMVQRVVRALEFLKTLPEWDGKTIILHGGSQGGFQCLAGAALDHDVSLIFCQAPAMCNLAGVWNGFRATWPRVTSAEEPENARNLQALYFDGANFARLAKAPAVFTVGLKDEAAVASTIFAMKNVYGGPSQLEIYQECGHGGSVFWSGEYEILQFVRTGAL